MCRKANRRPRGEQNVLVRPGTPRIKTSLRKPTKNSEKREKCNKEPGQNTSFQTHKYNERCAKDLKEKKKEKKKRSSARNARGTARFEQIIL